MESSDPNGSNVIKFEEAILPDDQPLHILQTGHILNAETLRSLDGIVITVATPDDANTENNPNISSELTGKIWQVVPSDGNSDVTHIIAVDQTESSRGEELTQDECELSNDLDSNSILSSDTLTSMLLSNPLSTRSLPPDTPSWALKLRDCEVIGDSYRGWIANEPELDLILTFHKQQTQSFWGTRQSPASQRHSTRLMWKSQYVPFDGIPFINSGSRAIVMECQFGPRRRGQSKRQNEGVSKNSFKQTCPARIYIKRVCKFPEYMVDVTNTDRKHLRSAMDKAFQELKMRGFEGHGEERWYVQLPTIAAHEFHELGKGQNKNVSPVKSTSIIEPDINSLGLINTRVHPKITDKIREFVQKGETRVYVIRKQLRKFVEQTLFESTDQVPERHNLSYFPTVHSIQNQIYQAVKDLECGKIEKLSDQILVESNLENDGCENSAEDSSDTSQALNQSQQEMITVTLLTPQEAGSNPMISRIETQLPDGTFQVSTTISRELLHRIKNFHCAAVVNESDGPLISLPDTSLSNNTEEKTNDELEQMEDEIPNRTFTVTMMEEGKILQIENNSE